MSNLSSDVIKLNPFHYNDDENKSHQSKKKAIFSILIFSFITLITRYSSITIPSTDSKEKIRAITVASDVKLIPSGEAVCMKIKSDGALVVGVKNENGLPAKKAGIKNGDLIKKVNNIDLMNTKHFEDILKNSQCEELSLEVIRNGKTEHLKMKPQKNESEQIVCGLWLRDSAAGIGTITYYTENLENFAALGHPVNDCDTDKTFDLRSGILEKADIKGINVGEKGKPGELIGAINPETIGKITKNNQFGIYGDVIDKEIKGEAMEILPRSQVKLGKAAIISTISNKGKQEFEVEITKISDSKENKDFVIKVTDEALIGMTGGIVQGMSGSPIIQDGRLVGAITHVMLNDSKKGYGISIEKMMEAVNTAL